MTINKHKEQNKMGLNYALWRKILYTLFDGIYFARRGKTADGVFDAYVSPGCQLNVLKPSGLPIDPVHQKFITRHVKNNDVVWDIGSNMGLFAFPAALKAKNGSVLCFEPDIDIARNMMRSIRRSINSKLNIKIINTAIFDNDGIFEFVISKSGRSMNKLSGVGTWHEHIESISEHRLVPTLKLDTAATFLPRPNIIKIDAEGAEFNILQGGSKLIDEARPVLLIEAPRELWGDLSAFFAGRGYVFFDGRDDRELSAPELAWDLVACPKELVGSVQPT